MAASAGAKNTVMTETTTFSSRIRATLPPTHQIATIATARRTFVSDEDEPPVDPVDVDAGHRRQQDRRDEEGQEEGADGRAQVGRLEDDDRQAVEDHVRADLGGELREPQQEERPVPEDGGGARSDRRDRRLVGHAADVGSGRAAAVIAGSPRSMNPAKRDSSDSPFQEDVARAGPAAQPDVRPEPVHEPRRAPAGVAPPEADHVAQEQLEDGPAGHRAERIRGSACRGPAPGSAGSPGSRPRRAA